MKKSICRSGARIMASLVMLLGSLAYIMVLAVINGSLGFFCAMGVTLFGAVGVAKVMGEAVALSYGWIIALAIGCGATWSSTGITTLLSASLPCCAAGFSERCALCARQSSRASRKAR